MTLEDFIGRLNGDVREFRDMWKREHENMPDEWPLEMDEGEWFEMFISEIT